MGYNTGIQENGLTLFFTMGTLFFTYIAFMGAGNFPGFLNEDTTEQQFSLGIFDFVASDSVRRFLHLSVIPTAFGLLMGTVERIPKAGNRIKIRTLKPLNLAAITFVNYFIQLSPAIVGADISATWFSDVVMVPWGYAILAFAFIVSIGTGFYYVTAYWIHNEGEKSIFKEFLISLAIVTVSVLAFIGFGSFNGFNSKYGTSRGFGGFDEYTSEKGWVSFFYEGPVKDFSHLIIIPSIVGLVALLYDSRPKFFNWFWRAIGVATGNRKRKKAPKPKKLGMFALIIVAMQLLPAVIGFDVSATWFSDLIMVRFYGYLLLTGSVIFGMAYGLYRSISGAVLHQR